MNNLGGLRNYPLSLKAKFAPQRIGSNFVQDPLNCLGQVQHPMDTIHYMPSGVKIKITSSQHDMHQEVHSRHGNSVCRLSKLNQSYVGIQSNWMLMFQAWKKKKATFRAAYIGVQKGLKVEFWMRGKKADRKLSTLINHLLTLLGSYVPKILLQQVFMHLLPPPCPGCPRWM